MSHAWSFRRTFVVTLSMCAFLLPAAPVRAQPQLPPACAVIPGLCSVVMSCDPANSIPTCTPTGCTCTVLCNAPWECGNGQDCTDGVCAPSPNACTRDSQCRNGQVCGSRGTCEPAPPPPPCTSDAACDDHDPCNGRETCDGRDCRAGARPSCDDGNALTTDTCTIVDRAQNAFRCDHTGPSACSASKIIQPTIRFDTGKLGSRGRRFVWSGTIETRMSVAPPHDLPSSSVRVLVADQAGRLLVDGVIKGGSGWSKDPRGGWTFRDPDPKAVVHRATFRDPDPKHFGRSFEIEGVMAASPARASRLAGGLIVDWTGDISGPCGVVAVPVCTPRQIMGEPWMVCRGEALR